MKLGDITIRDVVSLIREIGPVSSAEAAKRFEIYIRDYETGYRPVDGLERKLAAWAASGKLVRKVIEPGSRKWNDICDYEYSLLTNTLDTFDDRDTRTEELDELRVVMGTLPYRNPPFKTGFHVGSEGITVKMIDWPTNPYKAIFELVSATWGPMGLDPIDKWPRVSPEGRLKVVQAALSRQTLGHCLEAPKFTFMVEGPSRASFDQVARARIGASFGARGSRDNNWLDADFRIPNALMKHPTLVDEFKTVMRASKDLYKKILETGKGNWQTARCVLSQNVCYKYAMTMNYAALQNFAFTRMKFCEQEDTVATAWLLWAEMMKQFPLLGVYMRPGCDFAGKCQYHKTYHLSELFGCLFKPCGRNPASTEYEYVEFNEACSDAALMSQQIKIPIPTPLDWEQRIKAAIIQDMHFFEGGA